MNVLNTIKLLISVSALHSSYCICIYKKIAVQAPIIYTGFTVREVLNKVGEVNSFKRIGAWTNISLIKTFKGGFCRLTKDIEFMVIEHTLANSRVSI